MRVSGEIELSVFEFLLLEVVYSVNFFSDGGSFQLQSFLLICCFFPLLLLLLKLPLFPHMFRKSSLVQIELWIWRSGVQASPITLFP